MAWTLDLTDARLIGVPGVQGLRSEADAVKAAIKRHKPRAVALGIAPEAIAAMRAWQPVPEAEAFDELPDHDLVYSLVLKQFGAVALPSPDLAAALAWADESGVPVTGIDMGEDEYETLFTKTVGTITFLRYGNLQRRLAKRPPKADNARAFALAWDDRIRRLKPIARIEAARENHMAEAALALANEGPGNVLLVLDVARDEGVRHALSERGHAVTP